MGRGSYYGGQSVRPGELDAIHHSCQQDPEYERLAQMLRSYHVDWNVPSLLEHVSFDFFAWGASVVVHAPTMLPDNLVRHPGGYGYMGQTPMRPREQYLAVPFDPSKIDYTEERAIYNEAGSTRGFRGYGPGNSSWNVRDGHCIDGKVWLRVDRAAWSGHPVASEPEVLRFAHRALQDPAFATVYDSAERLGGRAGSIGALLLKAREGHVEESQVVVGLKKLQDRVAF